ncbi:putative RNA-directed DNA polymerase [Aphis craccivora]|uniref:Putative RNA-directed DNA polymerase n=1 Tax=Aphis craccivora TaxID=307492 RepID=A0A6G0ZRH1_APHCR|nr:putative RNA-directed DNA polymerase [Aphis craccivora]
MYKSIIRPVWTYIIQVWDTSSPRYFSKNNLHKGLKMFTFNRLEKLYYIPFHTKLSFHISGQVTLLSTNCYKSDVDTIILVKFKPIKIKQ